MNDDIEILDLEEENNIENSEIIEEIENNSESNEYDESNEYSEKNNYNEKSSLDNEENEQKRNNISNYVKECPYEENDNSFAENNYIEYSTENSPYYEYAEENDLEKLNLKNKKYFSYKKRIYICIVLILLLTLSALFLMKNSFLYSPAHTIDYSEKSDIDYIVHLKENNFYDKDYLEKDQLYIASLIKNIEINFYYDFFINEEVNIDFNYKFVGKLLIQNEQKNNTYYEKDFTLKEEKSVSLKNITSNNINENLVLDYDYYNNIANSFKSEYKITPVSSFIVYLVIDKKGDNFESLNNNSVMEVEIPLSKQSVSISVDYKKINNDSKLLKKSEIRLNNIYLFILSLLLTVLLSITLIILIKLIIPLINVKSKYERSLKKLLNQYDRVIVNSKEEPDNNKKQIKINDFKELLDLRDITKLPIKYYKPNDNKSIFYLDYDNKVYLYIMKRVDYEKK